MKFKPGDLVIKNTGGNKMRIVECKDDGTVHYLVHIPRRKILDYNIHKFQIYL